MKGRKNNLRLIKNVCVIQRNLPVPIHLSSWQRLNGGERENGGGVQRRICVIIRLISFSFNRQHLVPLVYTLIFVCYVLCRIKKIIIIKRGKILKIMIDEL